MNRRNNETGEINSKNPWLSPLGREAVLNQEKRERNKKLIEIAQKMVKGLGGEEFRELNQEEQEYINKIYMLLLERSNQNTDTPKQ